MIGKDKSQTSLGQTIQERFPSIHHVPSKTNLFVTIWLRRLTCIGSYVCMGWSNMLNLCIGIDELRKHRHTQRLEKAQSRFRKAVKLNPPPVIQHCVCPACKLRFQEHHLLLVVAVTLWQIGWFIHMPGQVF